MSYAPISTSTSNELQPSYFDKVKSCLSSPYLATAGKCAFFTGAMIASLWIPSAPLAGASMSASAFWLLRSVTAPTVGPKSWKQLALGCAISAGGGAAALAFYPNKVSYFIQTMGAFGGFSVISKADQPVQKPAQSNRQNTTG